LYNANLGGCRTGVIRDILCSIAMWMPCRDLYRLTRNTSKADFGVYAAETKMCQAKTVRYRCMKSIEILERYESVRASVTVQANTSTSRHTGTVEHYGIDSW
jgi:hypothetical protein